MFNPETKARYRVDSFPIASELINHMMTALLAEIKGNELLTRKLFQIDYLSTLSGEIAVSMLYHKSLNEEWVEQANALKSRLEQQGFKVQIIGRANKQKIALDCDYVEEILPVHGKNYVYRQVENSFTQPNAEMNIKMLEWARNCTKIVKAICLSFTAATAIFRLPWRKTSAKCWQPKSQNLQCNRLNTILKKMALLTYKLSECRQKNLPKR